MNNIFRVVAGFWLAATFSQQAQANGSWDAYTPQTVEQGTGVYLNGWGYYNGVGDMVANIYVDGNIVGQTFMTDYREVYGGGTHGWHLTINTHSLSVGTHSISVWIGSNAYGDWMYFSQPATSSSGVFTVTTANLAQSIRFIPISNRTITSGSIVLNGSGLDQPFYRATYSDLNNAYGNNVSLYWDHWIYNGFNEGRLPFAGGNSEGAASSQSGLPVTFSMVSGSAYLQGNTVYFSGPGDVTVRATQAGGMSNGKNFYAAYADRTFTITNNAPTVAWVTASLPPITFYTGANIGARSTGSDSDGNLASVTVQYKILGETDWTNLSNVGGGDGSTATTPAATIPAGVPGKVYSFQTSATDQALGNSGWIAAPQSYTVTGRNPYGAAISGGGAGVNYNAPNLNYEMWVDTPINISAQIFDLDGDLVSHNITRINSPLGTDWVLLNDGAGGRPNNSSSPNGSSSSKTVSYTPLVPGRYDFHTNGADSLGATATTGASITVYVYGPNNGSTYLSQTVNGQANPSALTIPRGQTFPVVISLRNSGEKPWTTDPTPHRLGANNDVTTWGLSRVALAASPVNPLPQSGSDATFTFTATAPLTPGIYTFQWRMLEEGVQWFGALSAPVTITVPNPPPVVVSATGGTSFYGQTFNTSVRATDPSGDLAEYRLVVANVGFNAAANNWEGSSPDGWKWRHFRSASVSGADTTLAMPVQDLIYGTPTPLAVGTYRINLWARDTFPNATYSAGTVLATLTVNAATPSGTYASPRNFLNNRVLVAADLNATFANPYTAAAAPGVPIYKVQSASGSLASPAVGSAVTVGTTLTAGSYVIRATYPAGGNYGTGTVDSVFTISSGPTGNDDGDALPNGVETLLGTNQFSTGTTDSTNSTVNLNIHKP